MLPLLNPLSEFYLPRKLPGSGLNCAIVFAEGAPAALSGGLANDIPCLDGEHIPVGAHDCLIVHAAANEAAALARLRDRFPNQRFAGLGEEVFPALLARQPPLAHSLPGVGPPCRSLTLVLATPWSGSSHVANVVAELGQGDCREHLRGDLAKALASGYRFDLTLAFRRFLFLIGLRHNGKAATRINVAHLIAWLFTRPDPWALGDALAGIAVNTIITDRSDRVAQAVSGTIAELSGAWQNRPAEEDARIRDVPEGAYSAPALFWRFQSYSQQGHVLTECDRWFPGCLRLDYDRDIATTSTVALARRISHAFRWPFDPGAHAERPHHCKLTAAPVASTFKARFTADMRTLGIHDSGAPRSAPAIVSGTQKEKAPRLVMIGFNKCGTSSLSDLFRQCGHPTAHWRDRSGQFLAPLIFSNLHLGRPLLCGLSDYSVISDLFFLDDKVYLEANSLFKTMATDHPNTRFLLNTRNREAWIASRLRHETPGAGRIADRASAFFRIPAEQVVALWRNQWDRHHDAVREFFRSEPQRCLEFDIERDPARKLADWLGPEWNIDPSRLRHLNRSALRETGRA